MAKLLEGRLGLKKSLDRKIDMGWLQFLGLPGEKMASCGPSLHVHAETCARLMVVSCLHFSNSTNWFSGSEAPINSCFFASLLITLSDGNERGP